MTKISSLLAKLLASGSALVAISGCSTGFLIGDKYGDPPPQVVFLGAVDAKGQDYLTWHRPWAFGPVPPDLQAVGDISCMRMDLGLRATGYHPKALDRKGVAVPGGGFFCQLTPLSGSSSPPKVILRNGEPGWDRPSAFGAVPANKLAAGIQACSNQNSKYRPLGFHPRPIDINGKVMEQGGFLCVE